MLERLLADGRVVVAKGTPLVLLVLEKVRVDGADLHAVRARELADLGGVLALLEIPQHVHRDGRAAAGDGVDLARVGELVVGVDRGGVLEELAEAGAGVGKAPAGRLNVERVERLDGAAEKFGAHKKASCAKAARSCQS